MNTFSTLVNLESKQATNNTGGAICSVFLTVVKVLWNVSLIVLRVFYVACFSQCHGVVFSHGLQNIAYGMILIITRVLPVVCFPELRVLIWYVSHSPQDVPCSTHVCCTQRILYCREYQMLQKIYMSQMHSFLNDRPIIPCQVCFICFILSAYPMRSVLLRHTK